jgi:hypothetical protein
MERSRTAEIASAYWYRARLVNLAASSCGIAPTGVGRVTGVLDYEQNI